MRVGRGERWSGDPRGGPLMAEVADNTLVDERYRVLERIGSGGMADVYRAEDTHLGRQVALKVLHRRFAEDDEFVERFRREASAAAGLQHPNVVNVFDRGEHGDTYYIAMEHLDGRTLKDLIRTQAPLPQEQVIELGIRILRAAGFAHRRGVIHRDLKPHNVIVGGEDTVKVTDFGIARAGASEMTETGSIMGTAHYLSPEQAQGHGVSAASDLYSVGVILYEALTGQAPFEGDSAVSIAVKHLSEQPRPIRELRPDVHPQLDAVVMRALAKDPAQRYPSADEFIAALQTARTAIQSGIDGEQRTAAFAPVAEPVPFEDTRRPWPPPLPPDVDEGRRRAPWVALALLALAGLGLALFALTRQSAEPPVRVPAVEGQRLSSARTELERAGFEVDVTNVRSSAGRGRVLDQDPDPGRRAEPGATVELTVSSGPGERDVPDVEGLSRRRAAARLRQASFRVTEQTRNSDDVPKGTVIRTVPPAGSSQPVGSRVRLIVSSGPEQVAVPRVVGLSRETALARLERDGFEVELEEQESEQPKGDVVAQRPAAGIKVDKGSTVTLVISKGVPLLEVPDVVGLVTAQASDELIAAGFTVQVREKVVDSEDQDGVVVLQRPPAGSQRERGRRVVILSGRFEPAGEEPAGQ